MTTASTKQTFQFSVNNAPSDGSQYVVFQFPAGFLSRTQTTAGTICDVTATDATTCTTTATDAYAYCFFSDHADLTDLSGIDSCNGNANLLGSSAVSSPTVPTLVAVLSTRTTFKLVIDFLHPSAYPSDTSLAQPSVTVYAANITTTVATVSNVIEQSLPYIDLGTDFADSYNWYIRILSGSNYIYTSSALVASTPSAHLDVTVYPATDAYALLSNLFAGDGLRLELSDRLYFVNPTCTVYYASYATASTVTNGSPASHSASFTTTASSLTIPLSKGLYAQNPSTNALRVICSNLAFRWVPATTALPCAFYTRAAAGTTKSTAVSALQANPASSPVSVTTGTLSVAMSGTTVIADSVTAVFTLTFAYTPLSATTLLSLTLPTDIGWSAATTCTLKLGSSSTASSVPVTLSSATNATITIDAQLQLTNTLSCVLTPPYYAQNDVSGVAISLAHNSWGSTGYPLIAKGTFTWLTAKAGTWSSATFTLDNKYVGDDPGSATLILRVPSLRSDTGTKLVFTFSRYISVNAGGTSTCTFTNGLTAVAHTYVLTPSASTDNDHQLVVTLGASVAAGVSYVRVLCTNFQSPSTIVGTLSAAAQQTNADGRVIMSASSVTVNAGITPDFGSTTASVAASPAETGAVTELTITMSPAITDYNWGFNVPSLWTVPAATDIPTCEARYLTSVFALPYSRSGQIFRFNTTVMRMSVTTLDPVVVTCEGLTAPYVTTAASTKEFIFFTDEWDIPSPNPTTVNVAWPAIVPGITAYKSVTLLSPLVYTVTDATFTFQLDHTKAYELQGVLALTWPSGWTLNATGNTYSYTEDGSGGWTEVATPVGGDTACAIYQGSNNLPTTVHSVTDVGDGTTLVSLTLGSSTQTDEGDVRVECSNIRTYRGAVDTHVVGYQYTDSTGSIIEQTNVLLPSLAAAPLGWHTAAVSHSDLFPGRDGTLTAQLRGVSTSLLSGEALCVQLPLDFDVSTASAMVANEAYYSSSDVAQLAAHMSVAEAHAALLQAGVRSSLVSSASTMHVFAVDDVSVAGCTLLRDGVSIPVEASASRNTTTDASSGLTSVETDLCIALQGTDASELIERGMAVYDLSCPGVITSPYAHAARSDLSMYTRTDGHLVLDLNTTASFPEIEPGPLGLSTRTATHSPGTAGSSGSLEVVLNSLTTALDAGHTLTVELPDSWTIEDCTATIAIGTAAAAAAACTTAPDSSKLLLTLTLAEAVPAGSKLTVDVTTVVAPSFSAPAETIAAYTSTPQGYVVDYTDALELGAIAPGVIGSDAAAVLVSPFTDAAVSTATFLMYPLPNGIPAGGKVELSLPSSPMFPQFLDGGACTMTYYYPPGEDTALATGETISGAEVYDNGSTATGTTVYTAASHTLVFTPSNEVPSGRIAHLACSYWRNPSQQQYAGISFSVNSYASDGTLIDSTDDMAIDSGYPVTLEFTTQPNEAALVNTALPVAPVVGGVDYFGEAARGGAYISMSLVRNDNDPNAAMSGNTTQLLADSAARFPGLSVDTVGYGYQLEAFCYGTTALQSTLFSVWEGSDSSKFFWSEFPYLVVLDEPFAASSYVRLPNSTLIDTAALVDVVVTLRDAATGEDVSHLMGGSRNITTVDGVAAMDDLVISTPGTYYLSAFSSQGYFLAAQTPRFRVVDSTAAVEDILFEEDTETVRATVSLVGLEGADAEQLATLREELDEELCEYISLYYEGQCDRLLTVSVDSTAWVLDIQPHDTRGGRPNANELAELLRTLIIDKSSVWYLADPSDHTDGVSLSTDDGESEPWITLGVVSGGLGVGVLAIGGALLRRFQAPLV